MLTNIDIDENLVAEAMRLSGARTKREVVDRALREMVARAIRPSIRELFGIGGVEPDYDPKAPWAHNQHSAQYRVEEPRGTYATPSRPAGGRAPAASPPPPEKAASGKSGARKANTVALEAPKPEPVAKLARRAAPVRKR